MAEKRYTRNLMVSGQKGRYKTALENKVKQYLLSNRNHDLYIADVSFFVPLDILFDGRQVLLMVFALRQKFAINTLPHLAKDTAGN